MAAAGAYGSPRRRSLSDSLDYDDELAELMTRSKERPFRMSDEDTEDASEDGGERDSAPQVEDRSRIGKPAGAVTEIKEQVYYDKMAMLKDQLTQLKDGVHPEFLRGVERMTAVFNARVDINKLWERMEREQIERDFMREKKAALREFEDKKIELKENLLTEFRDRRKQIEVERTSMDLCSDTTEVKTISTRKLRRRPNEPPVPAPEKRRKAPQSQITFLLDEKEIEADILSIFNAKASSPTKKSNPDRTLNRGRSKSPSPLLASDTRIEDGKLFFEKRWFHRGQQIYLEGKDIPPQTSAVISAISQDTVWVRKLGEPTKIRVTVSQLIKGKYAVKRRA